MARFGSAALGLGLSVALSAALPAAAGAQAQYGAQAGAARVPVEKALYATGLQGKRLLDGPWGFRRDGATAWAPVSVPHVWNADDLSVQSMLGGVGWYRKEFVLPDDAAARAWRFRFEGANHRVSAWLNDVPIGRHEGAYLPFELPATGARPGVNRLVVRVDSRTGPFDLPAGGLDEHGEPEGGWWNYGGLPREVYLRPVRALEIDDVVVRSVVTCRTCRATGRVQAVVRNALQDAARRPRLSGTFGGRRLHFAGPARLAPGRSAVYKARFSVRRPALWAPGDPHLYPVRLTARDGQGTRVSWVERHGIRRLDVTPDGRIEFNFEPVDLRGASLHEDDPIVGNALSPERRRADIDALRRLGATVTRAHYPLHPYSLELADRYGIAVWAQVPLYQVKAHQLADAGLQRRAVDFMRRMVERDRDHASVLAWGVGNELPARLDGAGSKLVGAMAAAARELDPARLVALDVFGWPGVPRQDVYQALDVIGINQYFGWYAGPAGSTADRADLGRYLDAMRRTYPGKAFVVTEFGAEADREGPATEKGTYAFQAALLRDHLATIDARPWLSGAIAWTLRDFRVKPGFDGGNPRPSPPTSAKGLLSWDGHEKPAFAELRAHLARRR